VQTRARPLIWERCVGIDREFSLIATRGADGRVHVAPGVTGPARDYAATIGERLGIVGIYSVTFFETAGGLLVDKFVTL
jgi:phosphoribosylaminoimidazole carboxylase (NCAIR synthetase)